MVIGEDYPKIEFSLLGMDLVEPNSLIGNSLILMVSLFCSFTTRKLSDGSPFFKYWSWFYILFGISFFTGGLSHAFFNEWGVPGKYVSWMLGIVAVAFVEFAIGSVFPAKHIRVFLNKIIIAKMFLAIVAEIVVIKFINLSDAPAIGMIIPTINSVIGLGIALGGMGYYYRQKIDVSFKYLSISALVLIPNIAIQGLKINPHPWFDRNDLSHLLLIIACFLYLMTIRGYAASLAKKQLMRAESKKRLEPIRTIAIAEVEVEY